MRLFSIIIFSVCAFLSYGGSSLDTLPQFSDNTIIVKVLPKYAVYCKKDSIEIYELANILKKYKVISEKQLFPNSKNKQQDLSLIYEIKHEYGNTFKLLAMLNSYPFFEYAEPKELHYIDFIPNDQYINELWHLDTIKAFEAWDVQEGDTNIVVGIIDTGMDMDHEDLQGAIKYNYSDPIDGTDNDNDGYTDNFMGWDVSDNDNNPQDSPGYQHGTSVAGCVAPVTNNVVGIAGAGYKCKILPVKVAKDGNSALDGIDKGYEGVVYAADHGANIINCSWGSSYASQYGKDIVAYAISQGCLIVAAAGNTSSDAPHYPAAYDGVLAVANTMKTDILAPTSGRGYWLDLCAPGSSIKSTYDGDTYADNSGTSYAAPIAAGCAALVLAEYPAYSPEEIMERLKVTCDTITHITGNGAYLNQLGDGRINLYEAITRTNVPAIVASNFIFEDNNDGNWQSEDTITLQVTFRNVLDSTGGLIAELNSLSSYINIIDSTFNIGSLKKNESKDNVSSLFKFEILTSAPYNEQIVFTIDITGDNNYTRTIPFELDINNYFVDVTVNDLWLTVSSDGQIGYYEEDQAAGIGVVYNQSASLLFDGAFMIGVPGKVADMARGLGTTNDKDFTVVNPVKALDVAQISDFDVTGSFSDSILFNFDEIGVKVKHNTYAWNKTGHNNYVIHEYVIYNRTSEILDTLYTGIFADWDIGDANNIIASDMNKGFGYCYDPNGTYYAGIKELTNWRFIHQAMYNVTGGNINPNSSFSSNKKYQALSQFNGWAGTGTGQDVSHIVSTGPYTIPVGDSIKVAFAIMAGTSLNEIQQAADSAYMQYNGKLISEINELNSIEFEIGPNPFNQSLIIRTTSKSELAITMFDPLGKRVVKDSFSEYYVVNRNNLSSGIYQISISENGYEIYNQKVIIAD